MTFVAQSLALRGRDGGSMAELGGDQATALRASQGGGDKAYAVIPLSADAAGGRSGDALTPSADAEGRVRLRPPSAGVGDEGQASFTISAASPPAVAYALTASNGHHGHSSPRGGGERAYALSFSENQRAEVLTSDVVRSLTNGGGKPGQGYPATFSQAGVRRLTPVECERLQGFPDSFTKWTADGTEIPDSHRYRLLGNAVCVPVARWIGQRLVAAFEEGA